MLCSRKCINQCHLSKFHDDVIKWKHFPRNWPFVLGIHRSPVNSAHKGQWRGALKFSLIYVWINDWVNNRGAGDLRRYRVHSDVIVMLLRCLTGFDKHNPVPVNNYENVKISLVLITTKHNKAQMWCIIREIYCKYDCNQTSSNPYLIGHVALTVIAEISILVPYL